MKYANYQTDRNTKNSELFGTSVPPSQECLQIFQKIQNNLQLVYHYPRNIPKKMQNNISSRMGDIPTFV